MDGSYLKGRPASQSKTPGAVQVHADGGKQGNNAKRLGKEILGVKARNIWSGLHEKPCYGLCETEYKKANMDHYQSHSSQYATDFFTPAYSIKTV